MAVLNGQLDTSDLAPIPAAFFTHGRTAYLQGPAADAFLRVAAAFEKRFAKRLVAMSFYRPRSDQIRIFLKNYYRYNGRRRPGTTDRTFNGSTYRLRAGMSPVASPGYSNHGLGITVDFNSGVQTRGSDEHNWMLTEGSKYGWDWTEGKRIGEAWHMSYVASKDRMKSAPTASAGSAAKPPVQIPATAPDVDDVATAQKHLLELGYQPGPVDGSLGDATRAATKQFQQDAGLTVDGTPGPDTRKALATTMSKIDDLIAIATENQKRITRVLDAVENGKAGVRSDGTLVALAKQQHREVLAIIQPGKAGVRTDGSLVNVIKTEARKSGK